MGKVEDFSRVMQIVTELMDVTDQDILGHSRRQEIVDARWMVICFMREKGYSTRQISLLMMHPERTINHALNAFSDRVKYSNNSLRNILAIARQQLK